MKIKCQSRGQNPGKYFLGLRVMDTKTGKPAGYFTMWLRDQCVGCCASCLFCDLCCNSGPSNNQHFVDRCFSTEVVTTGQVVDNGEPISLVEQVSNLPWFAWFLPITNSIYVIYSKCPTPSTSIYTHDPSEMQVVGECIRKFASSTFDLKFLFKTLSLSGGLDEFIAFSQMVSMLILTVQTVCLISLKVQGWNHHPHNE